LATRIRLKRMGARGKPFYRIAVFDAYAQRDGKTLEILGTYDPRAEKVEDKANLKRDRVIFWLDRGAKPTETVRNILKNSGIHT